MPCISPSQVTILVVLCLLTGMGLGAILWEKVNGRRPNFINDKEE